MEHTRFRRVVVSVLLAVGFVGAVVVPASATSAAPQHGSVTTQQHVPHGQHQMRPADWWWQ